MQNYAYLLRLSIKSLLSWKIGARLFRKEGITRICCRNSQFTNMGKYATISKEAETWISAEYKQTQRTREYICWPHYREFPEGMHVSFDLEKSVVARTGRNCSIPVAEREVQVQMEDGLGEVQSRWDSHSDCNRTACYSGRVSGQWQIIRSLQ